jgi:hypothetical protein
VPMRCSTPWQPGAATRCAVVRRVQGFPPRRVACGPRRPGARTVTADGPASDSEEQGECLRAWWKPYTSGQDRATKACLCRRVVGSTVTYYSTKHSLRLPCQFSIIYRRRGAPMGRDSCLVNAMFMRRCAPWEHESSVAMFIGVHLKYARGARCRRSRRQPPTQEATRRGLVVIPTVVVGSSVEVVSEVPVLRMGVPPPLPAASPAASPRARGCAPPGSRQ